MTQIYKDLQIHSALIPLSKGKFAIVDPEMYDQLNKYSWWCNNGGYAFRTTGRYEGSPYRNIAMHRQILNLQPNRHILVDHENRNKLDNRRCNLRICTKAQNVMNVGFYNGKTHKGICWDKSRSKWKAQITYNDKMLNLGRFNTKEEAIKAYDDKALELFKDFASINKLVLEQQQNHRSIYKFHHPVLIHALPI